MATPAWLAASSGQPTQAGQINQFLGAHQVNFVYNGVSQGASTTLSGSATNSNGLWIAQQFTPGGSQTIERWIFTLAITGLPGSLVVSLQTDSGSSSPSGTILAQTLIPNGFVPGSAGQVSVPFSAITFSAATKYWVVFKSVGDVSNFYAVSRTTAGSGASTSPDGVTWTAQGYGLYYNRFDNTTTGPLLHTYEDGGVRWTTLGLTAATVVNKLSEYNLGQNSGVFQSVRSFSYTGNDVTGLS